MSRSTVLSRRSLLRGLGLGGLAGGAAAARLWLLPGSSVAPAHAQAEGHDGASDPMHNMVEGDVDPVVNGYDPMDILTDFDYGTVSTLPNGQTLREYQIVASSKTITIAPGVTFPAWTYNGRVPGPTIRCTAGDRIRVTFINGDTHPHSIHFHGIHSAAMDGIAPIPPGGQFVYEFDAEPFGLHLYHCHTTPIRRHIHKGLYGAFIIDPPTPRPPAKELVMVMNAFDTNFDGENEFYMVNSVAFHYAKHPIPIKLGELVRIYLVNITEFDLINSFHLHANFFDVYRTGMRLEPHERTDTIMLAQGERHILEFRYTLPGRYMFHAHVSEFTELGWMGFFDVTDDGAEAAAFTPAARFGLCTLT